jgi:hypothetical protein
MLLVTNIVIVVPTVDQYAEKLDADNVFSGLVVSLTPVFAAAGIFLNEWMLRFAGLRTVLFLMASGSVAGNTLYALAGLTRSKYSLLVSRALIGVCSSQSLTPYYIGRTVDAMQRSEAMFSQQAAAVSGYVFGPLLAWALETFVKDLHIGNLILDSDTAPGWCMAVLYFGFMIKLFIFFEHPGTEEAIVEVKQQSPRTGLGAVRAFCVIVCLLSILASTVSNAMIEMYTAKLAEGIWGWSVQATSLYLAGIMALVVPICLGTGRLSRIMEDRKGLLVGCPIGVLLSVLLFDFHLGNVVVRTILYSTGLVMVLGASAVVKALVFSVNSKLVPLHMKTRVMTFTSSFLCLGRGAGSLLAALVDQNSFGGTQMGLYASSCILIAICYKHLKPNVE